MSAVDELVEEPVAAPGANGASVPEEWKADKNGRLYVPRRDGRPGVVNRQGEETVDQARERDSSTPPGERRPRRKPKTPPKPPAPKKIDLRQLEAALAEGFKAPGIICAQFGDEWAAQHFVARGPFLARNLVLASEHNPWLRAKLEEAASGQDAMMKIVGIMGVGGAVIGYVAPPIIYFLNLAVPDKAREMLDIPPRRDQHPRPQSDAGIPPDQADPRAAAAFAA